MSLTRSGLLGAQIEFLLTLRLRGKVYRFATDDAVIDNANVANEPDPVHYSAGLADVSWEDVATLADVALNERAIPVEVTFAGDAAGGWEQIAADDDDLGDAEGELAVWKVGDNFNERLILISGLIDEPEWGADGEPVRFSIRETPASDRGLLPPSDAVVDDSTWPRTSPGPTGAQVGTGILGELYPWVFGTPGRIRGDEEFSDLPGSPALLVEINGTDLNNYTGSQEAVVLLIAGHETAAAKSGSTVTVHNLSAPTYPGPGTKATFTPTHAQDKLGRTVTIVSVDRAGTGGVDVEDGDELWVSWTTENQGGIIAFDGQSSMRSILEQSRYLLGLTTLRVDAGQIRSQERLVSGFNADFYINEQRSPWAVVQDDLLPLVPVSVRVSDLGLSLVVWPVFAEAADRIEAIDVDVQTGQRIDPVSSTSALEVHNDIRIDYALDPATGKYMRHLRYAPEPVTGDGSAETHPLAYASWTKHRQPSGEPLTGPTFKTDVVQDPGTARAVLDWKLAWAAGTHLRTSYRMPLHFQYLAPGDVVTVTDADVSWDERVCFVEAVTTEPESVVIQIRSLRDWIRDASNG